MKFLMDVIKDKIEQRVDCTSISRIQIGAIIPYLYFHNLESGVFKFVLQKDSTVIFEKQFTKEDIASEINEAYAHIYYPVVPGNPLPIEAGEYTFRIESVSDYNPTANSFLGWIKQHEDIQLPMAYNPLSDVKNTYTIRFKEYKGIH